MTRDMLRRGARMYTLRNAFLKSNDDLRPAGKTDLLSVENKRPTEMSRNKRLALNAATVACAVGI